MPEQEQGKEDKRFGPEVPGPEDDLGPENPLPVPPYSSDPRG